MPLFHNFWLTKKEENPYLAKGRIYLKAIHCSNKQGKCSKTHGSVMTLKITCRQIRTIDLIHAIKAVNAGKSNRDNVLRYKTIQLQKCQGGNNSDLLKYLEKYRILHKKRWKWHRGEIHFQWNTIIVSHSYANLSKYWMVVDMKFS